MAITGSGLKGATTVYFGETPVTLATPSASATNFSVKAPPGKGVVDVTVATPEGTSEVNPGDEFTYIPTPPVILKVGAEQGPAAGGKIVTITGTALTGATAVHFGTVRVPFTVPTSKTIKATSPAATALGTVDVTVTTPEGTSQITPADHYTFLAEFPAVEELNPSTGPAAGGNTVAVIGEGFIGTSAVKFGGVPAASFEVVSDAEVRAVAPPDRVSNVAITVTTPEGTSPSICPGRTCKPIPKYTFTEPTITSVSPSSGPLAGGTPITPTGSGFGTANEETLVKIGKNFALSVQCSSSTTCTAVTPASAKASVQSVIVKVRSNHPETSQESAAATFLYE